MRIISGKLKGKSISFIRSSITRPLKDSVKENIFNIIAHSNLLNINLNKSNILDLYSGVGSFGLECLSRGADKVVFIEKDKIAVTTLNINLKTLSIKEKAKVVNEASGEASRFLSIYSEYVKSKDVTRKRLYLDTMEKMLGKVDKVILDKGAGGEQGVVPYLPLNQLKVGGSS